MINSPWENKNSWSKDVPDTIEEHLSGSAKNQAKDYYNFVVAQIKPEYGKHGNWKKFKPGF